MRWTLSGRPGVRGPAAAVTIIAAALGLASACSAPAPPAGNATTAPPGTSAAQPASAVAHSGSWGHAELIPGLARLNAGGQAEVDSVSCSGTGNCLAGGSYTGSSNGNRAFVASERNGRWHAAIQVPGTAGLMTAGGVSVDSVSCSGTGNCLAGGSYTGSSNAIHAFVASERNGRWHAAIQVPGLVGPNAAGHASANGHAAVYPVSCGAAGSCLVSCPSPGNCAVGGAYSDRQHNSQEAVVASVRNGRWQAAVNVLSSAGLDTGGNAWVTAVSCASAGNCLAGGSYRDGQGHYYVFVVSQQDGHWQAAIELPGIAQLNATGLPQIDSLSCPGAGNCAAGGWYLDGSGNRHAFVASERGGQWQTAIEVPGNPAHASVNALSCGSPGNCAAGGGYTDRSGRFQGFVATERGGRWQTAIEVPSPHLNVGEEGGGGHAEVDSVSCARTGYCVAGGYYTDYYGHEQAFVAAHQ